MLQLSVELLEVEPELRWFICELWQQTLLDLSSFLRISRRNLRRLWESLLVFLTPLLLFFAFQSLSMNSVGALVWISPTVFFCTLPTSLPSIFDLFIPFSYSSSCLLFNGEIFPFLALFRFNPFLFWFLNFQFCISLENHKPFNIPIPTCAWNCKILFSFCTN